MSSGLGSRRRGNDVHLGTIEEASYSLAVRSSQAFLTPVQSTLFRSTCDTSMQIDSMHRDDCHGQGSVGGSAFGLIADRVGIRRIFEAQTVGDREQNISKPSTNSHTAHWHTSIEDEGKEVSL